MNPVSLQRTAVISCLVHITLFSLMIIAARHANHFVIPSPYIVQIVGPEAVKKSPGKSAVVSETPKQSRNERTEAPKTSTKVEEERLSEAIAELEAKKKLERIVKLRNNIVSLKARDSERRIGAVPGTGDQGKVSPSEDYAARIGEEIRQHWIWPETSDKNIEAIISIRILKNGSLQILGIEKSSGIHLFDRSTLRAITKTSSVEPPPHGRDMEIGLRFYPR